MSHSIMCCMDYNCICIYIESNISSNLIFLSIQCFLTKIVNTVPRAGPPVYLKLTKFTGCGNQYHLIFSAESAIRYDWH